MTQASALGKCVGYASRQGASPPTEPASTLGLLCWMGSPMTIRAASLAVTSLALASLKFGNPLLPLRHRPQLKVQLIFLILQL